jgi:glycosyltransferase involved in cell wall biosynthesis
MKKRVLIFSLAYYPHVGGAEVAIKEITDRIEDIEWHLITNRFSRHDKKEEVVGNVHVYRVGGGRTYLSKIFFVPLAALKAISLYRKDQFHACWAMMSYMLFPILFLRFFGLRIPYVLTLQEGDSENHVFGRPHILLFSPLLNYGFRHARVVQTISHFLAGWARERGFTGPLEVIPNGVDVEHFSKAHDRFAVRKALNIHEDEIILVTSSRLVHKNAIDDVLRALPMLPAVHFLVLGNGKEESILKKLAHELKVEERVKFVDYVSHAHLPAYLQAATIFVRPSRTEGMGNSFVEAMAAGLPVVATQEGGIKDFLFDSLRDEGKIPTGFAVDKDSPKQIAEAVERILRYPDETKKVVENARSMVFEKYDWRGIAAAMRERVFARVITG